jgi:hypothetical protein
MRTLTSLLPSLTCAGGMAGFMWLVFRGSDRGKPRRSAQAPVAGAADPTEGAQLSDEVARLRAELRARAPQRSV